MVGYLLRRFGQAVAVVFGVTVGVFVLIHHLPGGEAKVLFVKDGARVQEVRIDPGATIPKHHHDGPHLMIAVSDLELRGDEEGMGSAPGKFKAGDILWMPGGLTHTVTNTGKTMARMITVEF